MTGVTLKPGKASEICLRTTGHFARPLSQGPLAASVLHDEAGAGVLDGPGWLEAAGVGECVVIASGKAQYRDHH